MAKLIDFDINAPTELGFETPESQGAGAANQLVGLGHSVQTFGRGLTSLEQSAADASAMSYKSRLLEITRQAHEQAIPEREQFLMKESAKAKSAVLKQNKWMNRSRFDRTTSLYDADAASSMRSRMLIDEADQVRVNIESIGNDLTGQIAMADVDVIEDYVSAGGDFDAYMQTIADAGNTFSPDQAAALKAQKLKGDVLSLSVNHPELAQELLNRHQGLLDGATQAQLRSTLTVNDTAKFAQEISQSLWERPGFNELSRPEKIQQVRKLVPAGPKREAAEAIVRSDDSIYTADKEKQRTDFAESVGDEIESMDMSSMSVDQKRAAKEVLRKKLIASDRLSTPALVQSSMARFDQRANNESVIQDHALYDRMDNDPSLYNTPGYEPTVLATQMDSASIGRLRTASKEHHSGERRRKEMDSSFTTLFAKHELEGTSNAGKRGRIKQSAYAVAEALDIPLTAQQADQIVEQEIKAEEAYWSGDLDDFNEDMVERYKSDYPMTWAMAVQEAASAPNGGVVNNLTVAAELKAFARTEAHHKKKGTAAHQAFMDNAERIGTQSLITMWREGYIDYKDMPVRGKSIIDKYTKRGGEALGAQVVAEKEAKAIAENEAKAALKRDELEAIEAKIAEGRARMPSERVIHQELDLPPNPNVVGIEFDANGMPMPVAIDRTRLTIPEPPSKATLLDVLTNRRNPGR